MPDIFNPTLPPQEEPTGDNEFLVNEIQFGDGYSQALGDGLNDKKETWPLTWVGTVAEITPIKTFFDAHKGYISFYWTPPLGVQGLYRVKRYQVIPAAAGNAKITAVLEQKFAP